MLNRFLDNTQHHFIITCTDRLGIQGTVLTTIKAVNSKAIANVNLNGDKLKAFPLKKRNETMLSTLHTFQPTT